MPTKKTPSLASYKTEVVGTRFRHTFSSTMGCFSKPNPARNPLGADGFAHHRGIQSQNGRDDRPLNRAMGASRSNRAPRIPGDLPGVPPNGLYPGTQVKFRVS